MFRDIKNDLYGKGEVVFSTPWNWRYTYILILTLLWNAPLKHIELWLFRKHFLPLWSFTQHLGLFYKQTLPKPASGLGMGKWLHSPKPSDVVTHPCPNSSSGSIKPPLALGHAWLNTLNKNYGCNFLSTSSMFFSRLSITFLSGIIACVVLMPVCVTKSITIKARTRVRQITCTYRPFICTTERNCKS